LAAILGFALGGSMVSSITPMSEIEKQRCYHGADAGHYKADECKTFWERSTTDPVAFYTLGLFIFTGVLAVSTAFLWDATRAAVEGGEEQRKSSERIAAQQRESSEKIAKRSADLAEHGLALADRPWVLVDCDIVDELVFAADGISTSVNIRIKNVGKTPATNVEFHPALCASVMDARRKSEEWIDSYKYRRPALFGFGRAIFPDRFFDDPWPLSVDLEKFLKAIETQDAADRENGEVPMGTGYPAILVFVVYGLPSEGDRGKYRHTAFIAEVRPKGLPYGAEFSGREATWLPDAVELKETWIAGEIT
jgi:hypothetical protein